MERLEKLNGSTPVGYSTKELVPSSTADICITAVYILSKSLAVINFIRGAICGAFLITVMCSSFIVERRPVESFNSCVCVFAFEVPSIQRCIFIFLGSLILSVQNKRPSIIFIPVIMFVGSNFKTLLAALSTNTAL